MKTCPACQQTLTDTAKFCYYCGASLLNLAPDMPAPVVDAEADPVLPNEEEPISSPDPVAFGAPVEPASETVELVPEPEPVVESVPEPEPEPVPEPEPEPAPAPKPEPERSQYRPEDRPAETVPAVESKPETVVASTDSRSLMTTAGYIFTTLLFHVPVVGLVFMIVWGCGKPKNISLKRFSLAFLIMRLICYIIVLAAAVFVLICFSGVINSLWEAVKPILFA